MKIAVIVDDFHGGAGNIAQILALELSEEHRVSLVFTNMHSEPRYDLSRLDVYDQNVSINKGNKVLGLVSSIKNMKRLIKKIDPDMIISFLDNTNTIVCLSQWFTKTPIVVSERNNVLSLIPKAPWDKLRRIAYRRADVVTVQFKVFAGFDNNRFLKKAVVTPNIVVCPDVVKEKYETDTVKFVTFARLADVKRHDLMIELFDRAQSECPNMELHIYGEGKNEARLRKMIDEKGLQHKVFLHGYCKEVHQRLIENDVYLMTSLQEGFPNSLSEAMAVGLPSVSFECHEGIRDMTENDISGYVVDEGDNNAFVEKMLYLARNVDTREKMGRKAREISSRFSKENVMKTWLNAMSLASKKDT